MKGDSSSSRVPACQEKPWGAGPYGLGVPQAHHRFTAARGITGNDGTGGRRADLNRGSILYQTSTLACPSGERRQLMDRKGIFQHDTVAHHTVPP